MKNINIKIIIIAIASLLFANQSIAQYSKSLYFLDSSPLSLSMNPAIRINSGYISVPAIGGLGIQFHSNSLSYDNIMYPTSNGLVTFLDPSVDATKFMNSLADNNKVNVSVDMQILGAGFYDKKGGYWNMGVGLNSNTNINIPKEFFGFAKTGLAATGNEYDMSDLYMQSNNFIDVSLGYSREINEKLVIGGAVKFLVGGANFEVNMTDLRVKSSEDLWSVNSRGIMNIYMKGISAETKPGADGGYIDGFNINQFGVAGYGAALDLGITYRPIDNLKVVAAVTDLGFISWDKNSNVSGVASGSFLYDGFRIPVADGSESIESQFDSIKDDAVELLHFEQGESISNTKMITTSFNAGGEYSILDDAIGFGLLYSGYVSPLSFEQELTVSANFRPTYWFSGALSYSFLHSQFESFGFVLNFHPSWINFMIGTDYMITKISSDFTPISQKVFNVYLGLSVPIGVKSHRSHKSSNQMIVHDLAQY